ncbi:MAG: hypothetical protein ABR568_13975 [Pyrinomonadaceae bacterium]
MSKRKREPPRRSLPDPPKPFIGSPRPRPRPYQPNGDQSTAPGSFPYLLAPTSFSLAPGEMDIGQVTIRWADALLIIFGIDEGVGNEPLTPAETADFLKKLAGRTDKGKANVWPYSQILTYLQEHLSAKLNDAAWHLLLEAREHTRADFYAGLGIKARSFSQVGKDVGDSEKAAVVKRLNRTTRKIPTKRGRHASWTKHEFVNAMWRAVNSLKQKDARTKRPKDRSKTPNHVLLDKLAAELRTLEPTKAPTTGDATRKLIERLGVNSEWKMFRDEWRAYRSVDRIETLNRCVEPRD